MYWRPVERKPRDFGEGKCETLRAALTKRFGGADGARLRQEHVEWLSALVDADVDGAADLVRAVEQHGEIEIEVCW
jgi:hypothetical protein